MAGIRIARFDRSARRPTSHQAGVIRNVEVCFLRVRIMARTASLTKDRSEVIVVGDFFVGSERHDALYEQHGARSARKGESQKTLAWSPRRPGSDPGHNNFRRLSNHQWLKRNSRELSNAQKTSSSGGPGSFTPASCVSIALCSSSVGRRVTLRKYNSLITCGGVFFSSSKRFTTPPSLTFACTFSPFIRCSACPRFGSIFTSHEQTVSREARPNVVRK